MLFFGDTCLFFIELTKKSTLKPITSNSKNTTEKNLKFNGICLWLGLNTQP